jgi:hypothetical protein
MQSPANGTTDPPSFRTAKISPVQEVREYESFRDDCVAVISGSAVAIAVMGFWTEPAFTFAVAMVVSVIGYFLTPRSRGGGILAVFIVGMVALLYTAYSGYSLV